MKHKVQTIFVCATVALCAAVLPALGQVEALPKISAGQIQQLSHKAAVAKLHKSAASGLSTGALEPTISGITVSPLTTWSYSIVAYDGNTYTGQIVGRSPFLRGKLTTTVPLVLIPLRITIRQGGGVFTGDPEAADNGCLGAGHTALSLTQQSPLFNPSNIYMGGNTPTPTFVGDTTYPDAAVRASFWQAIGATPASAYHLALSVSTEPEQSLTFAGGTSTAEEYGLGGTPCGTNPTGPNQGGTLGVVNINVLDPLLQGIITSLGLTQDQFPFFVLYYDVISDGDARSLGNCCILGYHNALGLPGQTYGISEYDTGSVFSGVDDIAAMSHEVMEWIFDPSTVNFTPLWGNIGQVGGCQNNLEVGDPLSGTLFPSILMSNGVTYHPQEMAYYWWFFTPTSGGANGVFSNNGTFLGNAKACPPGGTN